MKNTIMISAPKYYGIDSDINEAFEAVGFKTSLISHRPLTILERVANKIGNILPILKPAFNPILKSYLIHDNRELVSIASKEKPDLLLIIKGDHILPDTLKEMKKVLSCPVVSYVWDAPFYANDNKQDEYRKFNLKKGIPLYDLIFVFDTSYIDEIRRQGAKEVRYLPLATNPNRYKEISLTEKDRRDYGYDVCFVGQPFESRTELFDSLSCYHLGVFGDYWRKYFFRKGSNTPAYYRGRASGEVVNKIYLSSKIVLNIHHPHSREGVNTRTFDIPACGAFEMVDYKKDVEKHFEIDKEIVTFNNIDELKSKIDFYLRNEDLRKTISERGKQRILNEHTWVHRAMNVKSALEKQIG